jgi:hypothetical protein
MKDKIYNSIEEYNQELLDNAVKSGLVSNGKDGKDYVLTEQDKEEIATLAVMDLEVPTVTNTETIIREIPNEETGAEIVGKINDLEITPDLQIDAEHIKNLPKMIETGAKYYGGSGIKELVAGTNITVDNSVLGYPRISATGGGGVSSIIAGTNITISPVDGLGNVTINATGTPQTPWTSNIDGGDYALGNVDHVVIGDTLGNWDTTSALQVSGTIIGTLLKSTSDIILDSTTGRLQGTYSDSSVDDLLTIYDDEAYIGPYYNNPFAYGTLHLRYGAGNQGMTITTTDNSFDFNALNLRNFFMEDLYFADGVDRSVYTPTDSSVLFRNQPSRSFYWRDGADNEYMQFGDNGVEIRGKRLYIERSSLSDGDFFLEFSGDGSASDMSMRYDSTTGYTVFGSLRARTPSANTAFIYTFDNGLNVDELSGGDSYIRSTSATTSKEAYFDSASGNYLMYAGAQGAHNFIAITPAGHLIGDDSISYGGVFGGGWVVSDNDLYAPTLQAGNGVRIGLDSNTHVTVIDSVGDVFATNGFTANGTAGLTTTLNDSNSNPIAEIVGGIITVIYY